MEEEIKKDIPEEEETEAVDTGTKPSEETLEDGTAEETAEDSGTSEDGNDSGTQTEPSDGDSAAEAETDNGGDNPDGVKKDGFFKKKKKDKRDEQIEELQDRLKRQMAEFENFRKRSEKEKSQMFDMGARSIIEKFLPVIDNFERGLAAVPEEQKEDAFVTGMDKVYKQMLTELENAGVKPIETEGQEFDPDFHNAVMQVESGELESGMIAQELQKGYTYKDTVVRHSMVSVVS